MSRSTVNLAFRRLKPKITKIQKIQQGTKNEGKWKEASYIQVNQWLRTEVYMGFENGNTVFSQDYRRCRSVIEAFEIVYRGNGVAVEGLADRNWHRRKVVGKE